MVQVAIIIIIIIGLVFALFLGYTREFMKEVYRLGFLMLVSGFSSIISCQKYRMLAAGVDVLHG